MRIERLAAVILAGMLIAYAALLGCTGGPVDHAPPALVNCGEGEVADGAECVPEACGSGTWGDIEVDGGTLHVQAGQEGDGSRDRPLSTIQAAIDLAEAAGGGRIAVAAGTYIENLSLDGSYETELVGRCSALVSVDGSAAPDQAAVQVTRGKERVSLEGISVIAGGSSGVRVSGAQLGGVHLALRSNGGAGLVALGGASVTLDDVTVADSVADAGWNPGYGLYIGDGSSLVLTSSVVSGNRGSGLVAVDAGTEVTADHVEVSGTMAADDSSGGYGVFVSDGARVGLTGSTVDRNTLAGLWVWGEGTTVSLGNTRVTGTRVDAQGSGASGIQAGGGAALQATGCTIQGSEAAGVSAEGAGTVLDLVDCQVLDNASSVAGLQGAGISAIEGAAVSASGTTVFGNGQYGVAATGEGTVVTVVNSTVSDTIERNAGVDGAGLAVGLGATMHCEGCTVQGNVGAGALAQGGTLQLRDTTVSDTEPASDGSFGAGVIAQEGASVELVACVVEDNVYAGIGADASFVDVEDTTIRGTRPPAHGVGGVGILMVDGAVLEGAGCTVEENSEVGVAVGYAGTGLTLRDSRIVGTLVAPDGTGGYGLQVDGGASAELYGVEISENTAIGAIAQGAGTWLYLEDSLISGTLADPGGGGGYGLQAVQGASVATAGSTLDSNMTDGALSSGEGSTLDLHDTSITNTLRGRLLGFGLGLAAAEGGVATADRLTISGTAGPGIYVGRGEVSCEGCVLSDNLYAGAVAVRGALTLTHTRITDTTTDEEFGGAFGVYGIGAFGPLAITVTDSTIGPHAYAGIWLDGDGAYDIERNVLSGSPGVLCGDTPAHGNAVFAENGVRAWDGASGLLLADNTLTDSPAIAVLLDGASALVAGNVWSANTTDLRQQRCEGVEVLSEAELAGVPTATICPGTNLLTAYDVGFSSLYLPEIGTEE